MPSAKQCNYSIMYSLKSYLLHIPIFYISLLLYPASDSATAPPYLNKWVSTMSIGIPFKDGYFNAVVSNFNAAIMLSALRSFLLPPTQYADKYVLLLIIFFGLIRTASPMTSPGWNFQIHCFLDKHTLLSIRFSDYPLLKCSICRQNLFFQWICWQLVQMSLIILAKTYCIFQLELHNSLCFVSLFFYCIFSHSQ